MYKLPKELYKTLCCRTDEELQHIREKYGDNKYCDDERKYITLVLFAYKKNKDDTEMLHEYKISFKDYYRISGIDGDAKNIFSFRMYWDAYPRYKSISQQLINYICKSVHKRKYNYDFISSNLSIPNATNTILNHCNYVPSKRLSSSNDYYRCIEYVCKDLNSEELDAIIYPKEYTHFKYEE